VIGVDLPSNAAEDSYNILPALLGEELEKPIRPAVVYSGSNGVLAIRKGNWVLIDSKTGMVSGEPEWFRNERKVTPHDADQELFNLKRDPQQKQNMIEKSSKVADRLEKLLGKYVESGRSAPKRG
jgi:hypothetical protein